MPGILTAVLCMIFFFSSAFILYMGMDYHKIDELYEKSAAEFTTVQESGADFKAGVKEIREPVPVTIDFAALRNINEEIGWIYCEGTKLNYPVLQGTDNDFYLSHTYDRAANRAGSIFVEALNAPGFADSNTIIYGHHMKNGSMFAVLRNWADQAYYEEHPVMWLLTPEQNYQIRLFSGYMTEASSAAYTVYQSPCSEFDEYIRAACANSDFRADVETDPNGRFVVLSTCEYDFEDARYVLHGMLVPYGKNGNKK